MKTTIEELERILSEPRDLDIEIQPDGSIRAVEKGTAKSHEVKVLSIEQVASSY